MKTIQYEKKITKAKTQYRRISAKDKQHILDELRSIADIVKVCAADNDLRKTHTLLTEPNKKLMRTGSNKYNSISSAVDGILDNFTAGTQYDFSDKTCTLIDQLRKEFNAAVNDVVFDTIIWKQVSSLPKPSVSKPSVVVRKVLIEPNELFDFGSVKDNF